MIGLAVPGVQYPILARSNDEGGEFTWFFIQIDNELTKTSYTGWVSGRYLNFIGLEELLPTHGSVFDSIDGAPDVGVYGTTPAITDMRRRPSGRSAIILTIPAYTRVSIIGRTRQNHGDFWYQVRYQNIVGWVPAFVNRGDTSQVPIR